MALNPFISIIVLIGIFAVRPIHTGVRKTTGFKHGHFPEVSWQKAVFSALEKRA
jgi:hypothetical protein